jgi:putative DNA primase/helicase
MRDLRSIARALGGNVFGRHVMAPGPGHSRKDRSLVVKLDSSAPDGFLVHSFAGDDWQQCRDFVRERLGMPRWEPGDEQNRTVRSAAAFDQMWVDAEAERPMIRSEDDLGRIKSAQKIWDEAADPSPAKHYLASRALECPESFAGTVLRYHPRTPWRNEDTGQTERIPCLIAAFRSIDGDIVTAVHRIRVDQPERWPKTDRRMLGVAKRGAIKLGPVGPTLAIGEGLETCMAAIRLGAANSCWALGSVGAISFFPVLDQVQELRILCETGQASAEAFKTCGRRWRRAGKKIIRVRPNIGDDLNDALMSDIPNAREA